MHKAPWGTLGTRLPSPVPSPPQRSCRPPGPIFPLTELPTPGQFPGCRSVLSPRSRPATSAKELVPGCSSPGRSHEGWWLNPPAAPPPSRVVLRHVLQSLGVSGRTGPLPQQEPSQYCPLHWISAFPVSHPTYSGGFLASITR